MIRGKWKYSVLKSPDGYYYWVRDRKGSERQVRNCRTGKWQKESKVKFSTIDCFEEYHRDQYESAVVSKDI